MPKPTELTLKEKQKKDVLKEFNKNSKNARTIAQTLKVPYRQVMLFLEQQKLRYYSENSYS